MSPINFDILQTDCPQFRSVWTALGNWFAVNWRKRYVEWTVLLRALQDIDRFELLLAIEAMIDHDMLSTAYKVKAPGGYLLEGEFDGLDEIPNELPDRDYSGRIRTAEGDVVTGLRWNRASAT
jgi:hypothetical protein